MTDARAAASLRDYMKGGRDYLDPKLHPYIPQFDRLRVLMFGRESVRNPSNIVHAQMTLDLIAHPRDSMTWHQALAGYEGSRHGDRGAFPMSLRGGNKAADILNQHHQGQVDRYLLKNGQPSKSKDIDANYENARELAWRESELTRRYLEVYGIRDLSDVSAARDFMRRSAKDFYFGS